MHTVGFVFLELRPLPESIAMTPTALPSQVPASAALGLSITLLLKESVSTLDMGRFAGKIKLFLGALQQLNVLAPQSGKWGVRDPLTHAQHLVILNHPSL